MLLGSKINLWAYLIIGIFLWRNEELETISYVFQLPYVDNTDPLTGFIYHRMAEAGRPP